MLIAALGGVFFLNRGPESDVPPRSHPEVIYTTAALPRGEAFMIAGLTLKHAKGDIEILKLVPLMSSNVEFLGAYTVWPRDFTGTYYAGGPGYPAKDEPRRHPAFGVVIPAAEFGVMAPKAGATPADLTVSAGFRIVSGDIGAVNGLTLVYRAGGSVHRELIRQAIISCVKPNPCTSARHGEFEDKTLASLELVSD